MADLPARRTLDADMSVHSLELVHDSLRAWWARAGEVSSRVRLGFETAVIEIAGNIIEHSQDPEGSTGRRFTLDLEADDDALTATFADNGIPAGVDLSGVVMAETHDESGRGLALALASLDSLDYRYEDGRNIWKLECRRG